MDRRRVLVFLTLLLVPLGGLEARLAWVQVLNRDEYAGAPRRRWLEIAPAPRGRIVDRHGCVLARDALSFDLWVVLEEFEKRPETRAALGLTGLDERIERIYERINKLMEARPERERWRIYARERRTPYLLAQGLSFDLARTVETNLDRFPGCIVRETLRREYPARSVGALVVGHLSWPAGDEPKRLLEESGFEDVVDDDTLQLLARRGVFDQEMLGRKGVERACQEHLRGRPGLLQQERDPQTGEKSWLEIISPRPGRDIELTLDLELQQEVEALLAEVQKRVTAVVLDPSNGEVLVLATNAPFDPNDFIPPKNGDALRAYFDPEGARPLLSHATQEQFALGSIFKIVTSIAGLEEGKTTPDRLIECRGAFIPGVQHTRCWTVNHDPPLPPHGPLTVADALERSCNCYFYELGQELGLEPISRWAERLGLGVHSGIELGDIIGELPRPEKVSRWTASQSHALAIGQGALAVTPIQVARLIAAVGNGGVLVRPHVVRGGALNVPLPIRKETLETVKRGLRNVVHGDHGTARESGLAAFDVAGKTSSAQAPKEAHAWFGGYTSKVAIVVLVEHGGSGGGAAAPVTAKILEKLK
ncbi:MAG: hypothetical protein HYY16_05080 [Planctomycetes bacterium]|nr:hypothetical protein [Planctomycetota bacterium]